MSQSFTPGRFVWHDLMTVDVAQAKGFYAGLFGWTTHDVDPGENLGTTTSFRAGEQEVGGLVAFEAGHGRSSHWVGYVSVGDVDAVLARARELGGTLTSPAIDAPRFGRFGMVTDPQLGWSRPFRGSAGDPPPGTPSPGLFCWDELHSPDPEAAAAFYQGLYGWTIRSEGEAARVFVSGEAAGAGLTREAGERATWIPHVWTSDVDAALASVASLGGEVVTGPREVPGLGRVAVARDPGGASFGLQAPG